MPRAFPASLKVGVALAVFMVSAGGAVRAQPVQTFVDEAVPLSPPDRPSGPLSAGQLTMEDVLKASRKKQDIKAPPATAAPVGASMQQVLRRATEVPPIPAAASMPVPVEPLRAPRFLGTSVTATASPTVPTPTTVAPAPPPAAEAPKIAAPQMATPMPSPVPAAAQAVPKTAEPCVAKTTSWTKTCVEAGYPENFKGQIRGETRIACPDGGMKDVWVANSCVPPEVPSVAAPLTTPSIPAPPESAAPAMPAAAKSNDGACGTAHGAATTSAPSENLCAKGEASRVRGNGPWAWTCSGDNGGMPALCTGLQTASAKQAAPVVKPLPSVEAKPKPEPAKPVPEAAPAVAPAPVVPPTIPAPAKPPIAASAPVPEKIEAAPTVDLCGSAAELAAIEAPTKNLCADDAKAGAVEGKGPWSWVCADTAGRKSNCATLSPITPSRVMRPAAVAPAKPAEIMAACGMAASTPMASKPKNNLCAVGKVSNMSLKAPWSWSCVEGRTKSACAAPKVEAIPAPVASAPKKPPVDGSCGTAANGAFTERPHDKLCDIGSPTTVRGEGPWVWACTGANGGLAATCKADMAPAPLPPPVTDSIPAPASVAPALKPTAPGPVVNGLCGSVNGTVMANRPDENLCATGRVTSVVGQGPWNWNCIGENGGMAVSCTAMLQPPDPINGACGSANGVATPLKPKTGLCDAGISSAVSGKGPWTWSCSGINGGSAAGCVAPLAGDDKAASALPSITSSPEAPSPDAAPSGSIARKSLVTPQLKSKSLAPYTSGGLPFPSPAHKPAAQTVEAYPVIEPVPPARQPTSEPPAAAMAPAPVGTHPVSAGKLLAQDISAVTFAAGSDNLESAQRSVLGRVADMMQADNSIRLTLTAYASNLNRTPREARRLSLSRALAVRDYLADKGIPNDRVDVRALGANVPSGEPDRVDIRAN